MEILNIAIVLTWNDFENTKKCVTSLQKYCEELDEILVVDNFSDDPFKEQIAEICTPLENNKPLVTVIRTERNGGYAYGNNFAIRYVTEFYGPDCIVWILNNDAFVTSDAFTPLLKYLAKNPGSIVGSTVIDAGTGRVECAGGGEYYKSLGKFKHMQKGARIESLNPSAQPTFLTGTSLALYAKTWHAIGGMDEVYFLYCEELDFQLAAARLGFAPHWCHDSVILHLGGASFTASLERVYWQHRATTIFLRKNFFWGYLFVALAFLIVYETLRLRSLKASTMLLKASWEGLHIEL